MIYLIYFEKQYNHLKVWKCLRLKLWQYPRYRTKSSLNVFHLLTSIHLLTVITVAHNNVHYTVRLNVAVGTNLRIR